MPWKVNNLTRFLFWETGENPLLATECAKGKCTRALSGLADQTARCLRIWAFLLKLLRPLLPRPQPAGRGGEHWVLQFRCAPVLMPSKPVWDLDSTHPREPPLGGCSRDTLPRCSLKYEVSPRTKPSPQPPGAYILVGETDNKQQAI